jgi:hypothetical protein
MEGDIKVRLVDSEEKSVAEVEAQLLKQHEETTGISVEPTETVDTVVVQPETVDTFVTENNESTVVDDIDEDKVLSYIGKRYNREISNLEELFEQRQQNEDLPEDVFAFLKYKKETGRGIEDFIRLNKDYDNMDEESLLFEYQKEQNPDLDAEDIQFDIKDRFSYDEDYDDDKEIKKRKLAKKKELSKAKKHFNDLKDQYKVPLESRDTFVPKEERDDYDAYKRNKESYRSSEEDNAKRSEYFSKKTKELFSDKFEGFKFNIDDKKKLVYKPGDPKSLANDQSDLRSFVSQFLDDNGYLSDAEAFHRSISIAKNPDKFAKFFYEKGMADAVVEVSRESKNIDMTRQATQITPSEGVQVRVIDQDRGNRLVIKKR